MEVNGKMSAKSVVSDMPNIMCKTCEDDNKRVPANGICQECEEHMCIACFGNHKKYKMCRDHNLCSLDKDIDYIDSNTHTDSINSNNQQTTNTTIEADGNNKRVGTEKEVFDKDEKRKESQSQKENDYEICDQHCDENIKFYCQNHDEVGCGDCMILKHKNCKVDYVRDKSASFADSAEFKDIVKQLHSCQKGANECTDSIGHTKVQIDVINEGFLTEVKTFRDDINGLLDTIEQRIVQETNEIKKGDYQHIEALEGACKELQTEISEMKDGIDSKMDDPLKLFVTTIQCKRKLNSLKQKLGAIMANNKISEYRFNRNENIEQMFQQCDLGKVELKSENEISTCKRSMSVMSTGYEKPVSTCDQVVENRTNGGSVKRKSVSPYEKTPVNNEEPIYMELTFDPMESKESMYTHLEYGQDLQMTGSKTIPNEQDNGADAKATAEHVTKRNKERANEMLNLCQQEEAMSKTNIRDNCNQQTYEIVKPGEHIETKTMIYENRSRTCDTKHIRDASEVTNVGANKTGGCVGVPAEIYGGQRPEADRNSGLYEEIKPEPVLLPVRRSLHQSLIEHQLRCDNLQVSGDVLGFKPNGKNEHGLFICKKSIRTGTYFEIEILGNDCAGNISIGFVPKDYPLREPPGHGQFSFGFHCRDGCIYDQSTSGKRLGPPCTSGDVIGIGVSSYLSNVFKTRLDIFVTRNRKKIGLIDATTHSANKLFPAIALQSPSDQVRVNMNAKLG